MTVWILKVLKLDGDELFGVLRQGGHLAAVKHDEFAVCHGLPESLQFRLKHIEVPQGSDSLGEGCDLGEGVHVMFDLADDLWVEDALCQEPVPDDEKFLTRRLVGCVKNGSTLVLQSGAEKLADDLESLVSVGVELASLLAGFGQLRLDGGGKLGFGLTQ